VNKEILKWLKWAERIDGIFFNEIRIVIFP